MIALRRRLHQQPAQSESTIPFVSVRFDHWPLVAVSMCVWRFLEKQLLFPAFFKLSLHRPAARVTVRATHQRLKTVVGKVNLEELDDYLPDTRLGECSVSHGFDVPHTKVKT